MTEPMYDGNNDPGNDESERRNWRRELEERARKGDEAVKRLAEMEKREAARDAGLDPKNPLVGIFLKAYEGDVTAEAMKDAATEVGLITAGQTDNAGQTSDEQQPNPAQQQMDAITQAAGSPANQPPDIGSELEKAYESGGQEALLDQLQKYGVPVTTRQ